MAGKVAERTCKHGYTPDAGGGTTNIDERSSCCDAPVTYSGDGDLYCKCCYGSVEWADDLADEGLIYIVDLSERGTR